MRIVITIDLGNEAMKTGEDAFAVISIAAAQIREYSEEELARTSFGRKLSDANGNSVGRWEVK
jgi:hypothetical protein